MKIQSRKPESDVLMTVDEVIAHLQNILHRNCDEGDVYKRVLIQGALNLLHVMDVIGDYEVYNTNNGSHAVTVVIWWKHPGGPLYTKAEL